MDQVHAPRRPPEQPEGPLDLHAAVDELLESAGSLRAGRAARTLTPGKGAILKQSLLALRAGQQMQDHVAPGPTTLVGLRGNAIVRHGSESFELNEGTWVVCPTDPHSVEAVSDTAILITVTSEADVEAAGD